MRHRLPGGGAIVDADVVARGTELAVEIVTDGTNAATCIVYDNASAASGTVLFKGVVAGASNFGGGEWVNGVRASSGLYLDHNGTGAACIVYYYPRY